MVQESQFLSVATILAETTKEVFEKASQNTPDFW